MRDHREGQDPTLQSMDRGAMLRASSFLSEISAKRMNRIQSNAELAHGAAHRALPKAAKVRRATPVGKRGGKAGKILRGQR